MQSAVGEFQFSMSEKYYLYSKIFLLDIENKISKKKKKQKTEGMLQMFLCNLCLFPLVLPMRFSFYDLS